jgi:PHD/YefM family antitoxin component YafN of YafNO toxin-antitoxin module
MKISPQYITDQAGNRISVVLSVKEFEQLMDELEELEDIRLYKKAKAVIQPSIPLEKAFEEVERKRVKRNV